MSADITILLASYNGEAYIAAQLESLFSQTFTNWHLTISDDCSIDGTIGIINSYISKYPEKISLLDSCDQNLGPCGNFARLLADSKADYIMFCDQDDVWLSDKIEFTMARMREIEQQNGDTMPILVHTDLSVVDENLVVLADSFWKYSGINPSRIKSLNRVVMQNFATGCTVMINRPLADLALPIPFEARMHDWWLALVATCFGKVITIDRPTVLYRQHGKNDSGAVRWGVLSEVVKSSDDDYRRESSELRNELMSSQVDQAAAFLDRYKSRLSKQDCEVVKAFCSLRSRGFFMRRYLTLRYGLLYSNRLANLGMLLFR